MDGSHLHRGQSMKHVKVTIWNQDTYTSEQAAKNCGAIYTAQFSVADEVSDSDIRHIANSCLAMAGNCLANDSNLLDVKVEFLYSVSFDVWEKNRYERSGYFSCAKEAQRAAEDSPWTFGDHSDTSTGIDDYDPQDPPKAAIEDIKIYP